MKIHLIMAAVAFALAGCAGPDLSEVNREPVLSPVSAGPASQAAYQFADDRPKADRHSSLWNDRQSRLFTDPRALSPGDILTVKIAINDRAKLKNDSDRSRTADRSLSLGLSGAVSGTSIGTVDAKGDIGSSTSTKGSGATARSEDIILSVAAVVEDVLPNGNMVIRGSQEVRVNAELRVLTIAGIVRPRDIGAENTISYDRIAEARISYGGRGRLSEVQQPGYGQQLADKLLPF